MNFKDKLIFACFLTIVFMGYFIFNKPQDNPINNIKLGNNDKTKVVITKTEIAVANKNSSGEVEFKQKKINPRDNTTQIIIKKDNSIEIINRDFQLFPLYPSLVCQFIPNADLGLNVSLIRWYNYYLNTGITGNGISASLNMDLYNTFSVLNNTYIGIYARQNYNGSKNYGFQIGLYL